MYALFEEVAGLDLKAIQSSLMVNKWTMDMSILIQIRACMKYKAIAV